jgi:hypothetical protein
MGTLGLMAIHGKAGGALSFAGWLSLVSGVIGVLSFIFAVWAWMRSDVRVRELTGTLQSVYDISSSILWETINLEAEDTAYPSSPSPNGI